MNRRKEMKGREVSELGCEEYREDEGLFICYNEIISITGNHVSKFSDGNYRVCEKN